MSNDFPGGPGPVPRLGLSAACFTWGLAEATFFFLVPDVLLSWVALDQPRAAWQGCWRALAGALVGGTAMYLWGSVDVQAALTLLEGIPAISRAMCDEVAQALQTDGLLAMILGPIQGTPYKVFAVQAGAAHLGWFDFLVLSVPARVVRFALVTGLAVISCRLVPWASLRLRRTAHLILWGVFYSWYFWTFRR